MSEQQDHAKQQQELLQKDVNITLKAFAWLQIVQLLKAVCTENPDIILPPAGGDLVPMNFYELQSVINSTAGMERQLSETTDIYRLSELLQRMQKDQPQRATAMGFRHPPAPESPQDSPPVAE